MSQRSKRLLSLIIDPQTFQDNLITVIHNGLDWSVKDRISYKEWVESYHLYQNIKINGLEQYKFVTNMYKYKSNIKDCHLFFNQHGGPSFDWHKDNVDVILQVVQGYKRVYTKNKGVIHLGSGQNISIPKGIEHKVISRPNTIALSFGL